MDWRTTSSLIAAAKGGDRNAFDGLAGSFRPGLEAFLRRQAGRRVQEKVEIDDLLQETFLRAFRSIGRFEGEDEAAFAGWLRTIAEHVVLDQARKLRAGDGLLGRQVSLDRRDEEGTGDAEGPDLAAVGESPMVLLRREERFDRLKRVLGKLRPDHARVIFLARVRGLPMKDVALEMGRTPEAVSMLLMRALIKLKAAFGETESLHLPDRSLEEEGGGGDA
jgi:RNA polymerase sigma-70 factor (ECF subfamily)